MVRGMPPDRPPDILLPREAAAELRCSTDHVRRLVKRGLLRPLAAFAQPRFARADVEALKRTVRETPCPGTASSTTDGTFGGNTRPRRGAPAATTPALDRSTARV